MVVNRDTKIGDVIEYDNSAAQFFFAMGMFCVGCPSAAMETLEEACEVHGTDVEVLIKALNAHFENAQA
ncbi:MAG: DUF1858 domain-containing protein [Clostridia bacterium]|nr:DUF1858 domain-containing protein [Clostridia bacterium]